MGFDLSIPEEEIIESPKVKPLKVKPSENIEKIIDEKIAIVMKVVNDIQQDYQKTGEVLIKQSKEFQVQVKEFNDLSAMLVLNPHNVYNLLLNYFDIPVNLNEKEMKILVNDMVKTHRLNPYFAHFITRYNRDKKFVHMYYDIIMSQDFRERIVKNDPKKIQKNIPI